MDKVGENLVSPSLEGLKQNNPSFEELESLLDGTFSVAQWRQKVEDETGEEIKHDSEFHHNKNWPEYLERMYLDSENGFLQLGLDGRHREVQSLGFGGPKRMTNLNCFMPAIWDDNLFLVNKYGTLSTYDIEKKSVGKEGSLNSDIVGAVAETIDSAQLTDEELFKPDYVRQKFESGLYESFDHDVQIEIEPCAYRGIKSWLEDDNIASSLFDLCEDISATLADGRYGEKVPKPYSRGKDVDKYLIPGTGFDGRVCVADSGNADAKIVMAGSHNYYQRRF